jgi:hypothetical protein
MSAERHRIITDKCRAILFMNIGTKFHPRPKVANHEARHIVRYQTRTKEMTVRSWDRESG